MKTLLTIVAAAGLLGGFGAWGQARKVGPVKKAAAVEWPIRELRVEGVERYTAEQIIAASGLKVGDAATKENFERARDRVLGTGAIESFGWKYEPVAGGGGFRATLVVAEASQFLAWTLDRVRVGREEFFERVKREMPLFAEEIPTTDVVLGRAAAVLEKMAAEKGQVEPMGGKVLLLGKDRMAVVFGPKAPPMNVAEVRFVGAQAIEARYLVKRFSEVAIGQPYTEATMRLLLESQVRPMYEAIGRLRARFVKSTSAPWPGGRGVIVTVEVEEGPAFVLEAIDVKGIPLAEQEWRDLGQFKTGETVSYSDIGKGMDRILERLKGGGYMKAGYKAQRKLNDEKKTVEVFIDVTAGAQYKFGRLVVKGLDLHSEPEIRKLWALKVGEPYRGGYPEMFLNAVRDRGVFDNLGETKAEVKLDEERQTVEVVLTFKGEAPKKEEKRPEG